jgi:hypothetical protein
VGNWSETKNNLIGQFHDRVKLERKNRLNLIVNNCRSVQSFELTIK